MVDSLDLSIPAGPIVKTENPNAIYTPTPYPYNSEDITNANTKTGTPSGAALSASNKYQLTIIGGFSDGFHFYPVIINGKTATIYPHNNLLQYGKTYYVKIDKKVFALKNDHFNGIESKNSWQFSTKKAPPPAGSKRLIVSADGNGDFNTVQGAIDFIPNYDSDPVTVFIKNGKYEEIVYFRNKTNITIQGENRDRVIIYYPNNETFNPHPWNIKTNERPGTFPSRRAAFAVDNSSKIHLINLTIKTTAKGQAEGLLLNGKENIVSRVNIIGSGDALQSNGSAYFVDSHIIGDGDTILGRGPAFFKNCELNSHGPYMWIRNTSANHGNVFVNCLFRTSGDSQTIIARAPANHGQTYPYAEAVLINCSLKGIAPVGWGSVGDTSNVHYWEFNSTEMNSKNPVDVSKRSPVSKQLEMPKDSTKIVQYKNPAFVLNGWTPAMAPLILSQPKATGIKQERKITLSVDAAAIPEANYQWFRNGKPIAGAEVTNLIIKNRNGENVSIYMVVVKNKVGSVKSHSISLK